MECNKDYRSQTVMSTDKDSERNGEAEFWMDIAHANDIELAITKKELQDHKENTNDMDKLFIEMNKTTLQKKLKEEQNRVEDIIEEIFKKVKTYKRKLKRMV